MENRPIHHYIVYQNTRLLVDRNSWTRLPMNRNSHIVNFLTGCQPQGERDRPHDESSQPFSPPHQQIISSPGLSVFATQWDILCTLWTKRKKREDSCLWNLMAEMRAQNHMTPLNFVNTNLPLLIDNVQRMSHCVADTGKPRLEIIYSCGSEKGREDWRWGQPRR